MSSALRWSAVVLAGLAWVFLVRLAGDLLAPHALYLTPVAPPLVVAALHLPEKPGAVTLAIVALLLDAGSGVPFGLTATLALPAHFLLLRIRKHLSPSGTSAALLALAVTPALHIATAVALALGGARLPSDAPGLFAEVILGALAAAVATPWLAGLTLGLLRLFGVRPESEGASA